MIQESYECGCADDIDVKKDKCKECQDDQSKDFLLYAMVEGKFTQ